MDAAITTGDMATVDRLAAEITKELEAGRRDVAAAARWAPAAPVMAELDRVFVGYEARIEAKRAAANRGEGAIADKFGQEAFERSGAIDARFALIRPGVLDASLQAIESARYRDAAAAFLNSGGVRTDLLAIPPRVGEQRGEITWGEMLLVLPFGNRVVLVTVTGDKLRSALVSGFAPACDPGFSGGTGRFPQLSGLAVKFHCDGTKPVVDGLWKAAEGTAGSLTPIGPADTIRLVTLDYLLAGGDGYAMFAAGANASEPGDALLDVVIAYVEANAPVGTPVKGRIVGP
jgi:5'-nucleotidase